MDLSRDSAVSNQASSMMDSTSSCTEKNPSGSIEEILFTIKKEEQVDIKDEPLFQSDIIEEDIKDEPPDERFKMEDDVKEDPFQVSDIIEEDIKDEPPDERFKMEDDVKEDPFQVAGSTRATSCSPHCGATRKQVLSDCVLTEPHHRVARVNESMPPGHMRARRNLSSRMDSEDETVALLLLLLLLRRRRRRRKRQRAVWMHPITSSRLTHGQFYTIMGDLRADSAKFFNYFRMSQESFNELLTLLSPYIQKANTNMRQSIPAEERLAITLRYLATGCSFADLHHTFRCGSPTARGIVYDVCEKIWHHLHDLCFPKLTTGEWLKIEEGFHSQAHFPNCVGAIDEKHMRLVQPTGTGSTNFSMVLLAVCDANYRFTYVDIGSYGKASDSSIYKNSDFYQKMQQNTLNIPSDKPVSVNGVPLPFILVGDEAFGLSSHMLRPYGGKNLPHKKKIFNYRLSRARRYIESAFGILTSKWHIFHRPLDVKVENAENLIRACCTLHNFVRERDGVEFEDTLNVVGMNDGIGAVQAGGPRSALTIREKFTEYFSSEEGSVSWQERLIENKV